ncbi:hypothetical protein [Streptomyces griseoruber]|uniref:Uncharacterized protein n=1 Tax=Streptomyces griseoruber TaxID=1943 RepID=A0A101SN67_9ACTN|nr:hypothetical protein [Streptomyces griseoruber]KUN77195.1 hypothetical protein AQJ64_34880 [Streptomyces griseoruber]
MGGGARHPAALPDRRCAVAGDHPGGLAVLGTQLLSPDLWLPLPSAVTGLATGPDGTLAVATEGGLVVFDRPEDPPPAIVR